MDAQGRGRGVRVVVVSPHLDDAVLSIGGTIHSLAGRGAEVIVATVFAGDPDSSSPASYWDSRRGATQGVAVRQRRHEDEAALGEIGASAVSLPWADSGYPGARDPDRIWAVLGPVVEAADVAVLPGWPLSHADHRYATMLVLERLEHAFPLVFYAEQPYASEPLTMIKAALGRRTPAPLRHAYPAAIRWRRQPLASADIAAQRRARRHYVGEVVNLGHRVRWASVHQRCTGEWLGLGAGAALPTQFR